jgi:hypothetical protein
MASYANFLGRKVTVSYRISDILLPASGTFVGDSGRSIFLEQHLEQRGRVNYFRWEIPYQNIHRISIAMEQDEPASLPTTGNTLPNTGETPANTSTRAARAAAGASATNAPLLPHRPKPA